MSFRGGRGGARGQGREGARGRGGAFPARGGAPVVRGNVWTRDTAAAAVPAARAPVPPQVAGVKRPRDVEPVEDDAGPATQQHKPALPELQDTLSRKLKEVRRAQLAPCCCALTCARAGRGTAPANRARSGAGAAAESPTRVRARACTCRASGSTRGGAARAQPQAAVWVCCGAWHVPRRFGFPHSRAACRQCSVLARNAQQSLPRPRLAAGMPRGAQLTTPSARECLVRSPMRTRWACAARTRTRCP
jgi:hypothetical protein